MRLAFLLVPAFSLVAALASCGETSPGTGFFTTSSTSSASSSSSAATSTAVSSSSASSSTGGGASSGSTASAGGGGGSGGSAGQGGVGGVLTRDGGPEAGQGGAGGGETDAGDGGTDGDGGPGCPMTCDATLLLPGGPVCADDAGPAAAAYAGLITCLLANCAQPCAGYIGGGPYGTTCAGCAVSPVCLDKIDACSLN